MLFIMYAQYYAPVIFVVSRMVTVLLEYVDHCRLISHDNDDRDEEQPQG